jgi:hypothetical protein
MHTSKLTRSTKRVVCVWDHCLNAAEEMSAKQTTEAKHFYECKHIDDSGTLDTDSLLFTVAGANGTFVCDFHPYVIEGFDQLTTLFMTLPPVCTLSWNLMQIHQAELLAFHDRFVGLSVMNEGFQLLSAGMSALNGGSFSTPNWHIECSNSYNTYAKQLCDDTNIFLAKTAFQMEDEVA